MGESSCVFQDFSLASQPSTSESMTSARSALGESVSFGRFLSESLDWGRFSSFNQRKYLEEAQQYSQPGSVAQKKAFFEARYKKAAHLRQSVALMEHTASSGFDDFDQESAVDSCYSKDDSISRGREESTVDSFYSANGDSVNSNLREEEVEVEVQKEEEMGRVIEDSGFLDSCSEKIVAPSTPEKQPLQESSLTNQPRNYFTEEISRTPNLEPTKIPKPSFSPSPRSNKVSYLHRTKENISSSNRVTGQGGNSVEKKRSTPKSVHASIEQPVGGASTPSKADVKTKIARFEAGSKTPQSSIISKSTCVGFKFALQTPQSESREAAWDRSSFSGRKTATFGSGNPSIENSRGASNKIDRLQGEYTDSFSRKSEKKEEKKEMDENELKEFRRSLCFKARPLPDFYRKTEPIKSNQKITTPIWSQSPVTTRISSSKEKPSQNDNSVPVPSQKPPLSRNSSCKSSTGAPNVTSFSKEQNNKWTFTFQGGNMKGKRV